MIVAQALLPLFLLSGCLWITDDAIDAKLGPVTISAGTFEMGCTEGQEECDEDETLHTVTLTHDYVVGETEVTQEAFEAAMGYNPSAFSGKLRPVEQVTWDEAAAYANEMSTMESLELCYSCSGSGFDIACITVSEEIYECEGYRLLTEAEWEGAARCGEDTLYSGSDRLAQVGWYDDNGDGFGSTEVVAKLQPNACGLYDMSGNVFEWTADWYGPYTGDEGYDSDDDSVTDPIGVSEAYLEEYLPDETPARVQRGGAAANEARELRVAYRFWNDDGAGSFLGFRLGRSVF